MRPGDKIHGFKILEPMQISSNCKYTFAEKDGKEYFIKQFYSPAYPIIDRPDKLEKIQECEIFEKHHTQMLYALRDRVSTGGNLIVPIAFFREGAFYYKVSERIDVSTLHPSTISEKSIYQRMVILRTISTSISILHGQNIVHGDLKPDNILLTGTLGGNFTAKVIDFDDCFLSSAPPVKSDVGGDLPFYSPELAQYVRGEIEGHDVTVASDIFALGLIFSIYLTGKIPEFDTTRYKTACTSLLNGHQLHIPTRQGVTQQLSDLVARMVRLDYHLRPDIKQVRTALTRLGVRSDAPHVCEDIKSDEWMNIFDKKEKAKSRIRTNMNKD